MPSGGPVASTSSTLSTAVTAKTRSSAFATVVPPQQQSATKRLSMAKKTLCSVTVAASSGVTVIAFVFP